MPVRQRENGRWQADVMFAGRRVRKDFATEDQAKKWEVATLAAMQASAPPKRTAGTTPPPPGAADCTDGPRVGRKKGAEMRTLGEAIRRTFETYYRGEKWETKSWQALRRIEVDFGTAYPLADMDFEAVTDYRLKLRGRGKSASTINQHLAYLSKVLRYAHELGALARMPKIEREEVHNLRLRWLSEQEEQDVLRWLRFFGKDDAAEVVEVLIDTGMRQSELFAITARDVSLERRTIDIWQTRHGPLGERTFKRTKNGDMRTIFMTDRVQAIVARRVQSTAPDQPLFPYDVHWLRNAWDRARAKMKLMGDENFVPYLCRHTCASRLVQRGVPIPVIQKWMGHKTIQITMRYANVAPDNLREAMETLNGGAAK